MLPTRSLSAGPGTLTRRNDARGANDGLWVWDLQDNDVYYSPRWKSMLGYAEDAIGNSPDEWFSRVNADDVEILRRALAMHLEGKTPHFENEHRMTARSGEQRWMLETKLVRARNRVADALQDSSAIIHDALAQLK